MKNKAAQQLGRLGGKSTSDNKAAAARANGAKGGRPKEIWKLYDDFVRLHRDGSVEHWDQGLCCYRAGWGPFGNHPRIGEAADIISDWEANRD